MKRTLALVSFFTVIGCSSVPKEKYVRTMESISKGETNAGERLLAEKEDWFDTNCGKISRERVTKELSLASSLIQECRGIVQAYGRRVKSESRNTDPDWASALPAQFKNSCDRGMYDNSWSNIEQCSGVSFSDEVTRLGQMMETRKKYWERKRDKIWKNNQDRQFAADEKKRKTIEATPEWQSGALCREQAYVKIMYDRANNPRLSLDRKGAMLQLAAKYDEAFAEHQKEFRKRFGRKWDPACK